MTFSAAKTLADLNLEPFPFTGLDGKAYELPNLMSLAYGQVEAFEDAGLLEIIDEIAPDAAEPIRKMPLGVLAKLAEAWKAQAESEPGESPASSPSSESTARPSKQTLRSGASKTRGR